MNIGKHMCEDVVEREACESWKYKNLNLMQN